MTVRSLFCALIRKLFPKISERTVGDISKGNTWKILPNNINELEEIING